MKTYEQLNQLISYLFVFIELKKLHDQVFRTAGKWFNEMSESMKVMIDIVIIFIFGIH